MARSASFHSAWSRAPLLRVALPFIGGLVIGRSVSWSPWPIGVIAALACALWYIGSKHVRVYRLRWVRGLGLALALVLFGTFWQRLHAPERLHAGIAERRSGARAWRVTVVEVISSGPRVVRAWTRVDAVIDSAGAHPVRGGLLVGVMKDTTAADPAVGDVLLVQARVDTIDRVPDPGGFDQRAWAATYGIHHSCFASAGRWTRIQRREGFATVFDGARQRIASWLKRSELNARERGLVKAVLLGVRDELEPDQKSAFARSGTMHVLAVSGTHVALIYGVLVWSLQLLGRKRGWRILRSVLILLALWAYAGLTGATPSVLRATVTFTIFCLADMAGRQTDPVNSLAGAAFLLLLWDPVMLGQLSFQLSFLAVLGIALFYRTILQLWAPPNVVLYYFWSLCSVSIAAQAFTTPLALLAFGAFPLWFLPANLLVVGLVALGVYGGIAFLVLHPIPVLGEVATGFMVLLLQAISRVTELFAHLPGAYPAVRIGGWPCVGLYLLVLFLAAWLLERWRWARTGVIVMLAVLLIGWGWTAHQRNRMVRLVVYDQRDALCCTVETGRTLTVFTDTLDVWTARKIDRHQRAIGARDVRVEARIPATLTFGDQRVVFLRNREHMEEGEVLFPPTLVVILDERFARPEELLDRYHPRDGFLLSPALSNKRRGQFRRWFREHGIAVHDVRLDGAYVR